VKGDIYDVMESVGGYDGFERLVKDGRQLHNRAVYDLFAGLTGRLFDLLKTGAGWFSGGRHTARGLGVPNDARQHAL